MNGPSRSGGDTIVSFNLHNPPTRSGHSEVKEFAQGHAGYHLGASGTILPGTL